jgi:CTP synthase (UTP-ammonia lyase)
MKRIVLLGDRNPGYLTHRELDAALSLLPPGVRGSWVGTDTPEAARVAEADGLWVVPGSPYRDDGAVYAAIAAARTSGQPFLATCGGFQYTVLEFARHVAGIADAGHAEIDPDGNTLVIERLTCSLVAQERAVTAVPGTRMHALCGGAPFTGFHWCNFGLAPAYVSRLEAHGLTIGARADDAGVEAIESAGHPFFMATLFQPQIGSIDGRPLHPVLRAFATSV